MKRPNFFIIGAPKCGTTSLYTWLTEHPEVFLSPKKEPHFHNSDLHYTNTLTRNEYDQLFQEAGDQHLAVGEASVLYLLSNVAVPAIESEYEAAKYVVMVRNPIDMACALHEERLFCKDEHIPDFEEAWSLSAERREGKLVGKHCRDPQLLDYQRTCQLGEQIERLFKVVDRDRVLVLFLQDMQKDTRREYLSVLEFLGVNDDGRRDFPVENSAKERRGPNLNVHFRRIARWAFHAKRTLGIPVHRSTGVLKRVSLLNTRYRARPPVSRAVRLLVSRECENDVQKLGRLLGRDLSDWLEA